MAPAGAGSLRFIMTQETPAQPNFFGLNIAPDLLAQIEKLGYKIPTPIQQKAIPVGVNGEDLIGIAQTGTGKTLAFATPMLQRLAISKGKGLVLLPTRELALQVDETLQKLGKMYGLRTAVLIGGASMGTQIRMIKNRPHVFVATPGRLIDHLQQKTVSLAEVQVLVLDEADRMLDMGFEPQIKKILAVVPKERQTMLFSATMPEKISQIARNYMKQPVRVEVARSGTVAEQVDQEMFVVQKADKLRLLDRLLSEYHGTVLVFSRTKHGAKKIAVSVRAMGHSAAEIHSNRSLAQRKEALSGFKTGRYRVLVATDIAARGIDVTGIELVINFDLPNQAEDYVHRIGRTGRAGQKGKAISFASPEQRRDVQAIENLIRIRLPIKPIGELPAHRPNAARDQVDRVEWQPRRPSRFSHTRGNFPARRPARSASSVPQPSTASVGQPGTKPSRPHGQKRFRSAIAHHPDQYGGDTRPKKGSKPESREHVRYFR